MVDSRTTVAIETVRVGAVVVVVAQTPLGPKPRLGPTWKRVVVAHPNRRANLGSSLIRVRRFWDRR